MHLTYFFFFFHFDAFFIALRPSMSSCSDQADDSFPQWIQPFVQQALSQVAYNCCLIFLPYMSLII